MSLMGLTGDFVVIASWPDHLDQHCAATDGRVKPGHHGLATMYLVTISGR
jgi:hypothetical protein